MDKQVQYFVVSCSDPLWGGSALLCKDFNHAKSMASAWDGPCVIGWFDHDYYEAVNQIKNQRGNKWAQFWNSVRNLLSRN